MPEGIAPTVPEGMLPEGEVPEGEMAPLPTNGRRLDARVCAGRPSKA